MPRRCDAPCSNRSAAAGVHAVLAIPMCCLPIVHRQNENAFRSRPRDCGTCPANSRARVARQYRLQRASLLRPFTRRWLARVQILICAVRQGSMAHPTPRRACPRATRAQCPGDVGRATQRRDDAGQVASRRNVGLLRASPLRRASPDRAHRGRPARVHGLPWAYSQWCWCCSAEAGCQRNLKRLRHRSERPGRRPASGGCD